MPKPTANPTLREVAERAAVSVSTASVALSGRLGNSRLSPACVARVREAAQMLGYTGNYHAGALRSGRSRVIGVASGVGQGPIDQERFWERLGAGIAAAASGAGYDLIRFAGEARMDPLERVLKLLETRQIDGLLLQRHLYPRLPQQLRRARQPVVVIFGNDNDPPHVQFNPAPGLEAALDHLAGLGHRQVAWLGATGELAVPHRNRGEIITSAARSRGMSVALLTLPAPPALPGPEERTMTAYRRGLRQTPIPQGVTAILCVTDLLALALQQHVSERGIACPGQLSIIGFDDLFADVSPLRLTSVSHQLQEIGQESVALLLRNLAVPSAAQRQRSVIVASRLVLGETTGPAPS